MAEMEAETARLRRLASDAANERDLSMIEAKHLEAVSPLDLC